MDDLRLTRRSLIRGSLSTLVAARVIPAFGGRRSSSSLRSINIMNFIRAEEPREPMDLVLPVREQMAAIRKHGFPATWLLQYDAMVEGPFVDFLRAEMPANHEVGIWFEMNRKICDDAGIAWRGNPSWEWDYHVPVAYSIGYPPAERRKLADTAMATFRRVFGKDAKSVASWNLDAVSVAHFADVHHVDAFGNCRDQLATDGFTIWGSPIAGYYPSRVNAWSPALEAKNQISAPIFRLLGQDPVYYYDNTLPYPDTMEPVWPSGQSETFVDRFLDMIAETPSGAFAYAQLGQENSFGWPKMQPAYSMQMEKLAKTSHAHGLAIETMGESGRRFKQAFSSTPVQAQVMLQDPFGRSDPGERTVWYQSRYFRANLHFRGDEFYLRDLHVYNDGFAQPYLEDTVQKHGIEQRMLAVLDGYHWSGDHARSGQAGPRAMGGFSLLDASGHETPLRTQGSPSVTETGTNLRTVVPIAGRCRLEMTFDEQGIEVRVSGAPSSARLVLNFTWDPELSALQSVAPDALHYRFRGFDYQMKITGASAAKTAQGARLTSTGRSLRLLLAQSSQAK
jgi:hypothetical protein